MCLTMCLTPDRPGNEQIPEFAGAAAVRSVAADALAAQAVFLDFDTGAQCWSTSARRSF